jgi:hypothetical protein
MFLLSAIVLRRVLELYMSYSSYIVNLTVVASFSKRSH